jgi:serine/threonine protein kinase
MRKLDHPHIVKIFDAFILGGNGRKDRLYIVMERANCKYQNFDDLILRGPN